MKKPLLLLALLAVILSSCKKEETEKPKVIYKTDAPKAQIRDTSEIRIADLPIEISGTDILIHPVGQYRVNDGNRKTGYTYERGSFTVSNYGEFEITGFLQNLGIQQVGTDSIVSVFDKPVLIQTATYLKSHADKTNKQILVYTLSDMDTNQDGKLDASDIRTLYIGDLQGKKLQKISAEFQELIDWNYVSANNRLYFRSIEDTNKSGEFDKDDVLHYGYLELSAAEWKVVEYKPV